MMLTISRRGLALLALFGIATLALVMYIMVYQLDVLINVDLYNYGLSGGPWLFEYWTYLRLSLSLISLVILANFVGLIYFLSRKTKEVRSVTAYYVAVKRRFRLEQKVSLALLGIGIVMMVLSIHYSLSIISFVSLGLIFWGSLFLYIRNEKYVKEQLLEETTFSSLRTINDALSETSDIVASYVPPRFLKESEFDRVFLFAKNRPFKGDEEKQERAIENAKEMDLEPPGSRLAQFFEQVIGTSFAKMNLQSFHRGVSKALIEELEIAQSVNITADEDLVNIRLVGSPFAAMCSDASKLERIHNSIGCPVCSAFACALARITGKFVAIKSEQADKEKRTVNTEYLLSDHPVRR